MGKEVNLSSKAIIVDLGNSSSNLSRNSVRLLPGETFNIFGIIMVLENIVSIVLLCKFQFSN
jgi:hypothetical protein